MFNWQNFTIESMRSTFTPPTLHMAMTFSPPTLHMAMTFTPPTLHMAMMFTPTLHMAMTLRIGFSCCGIIVVLFQTMTQSTNFSRTTVIFSSCEENITGVNTNITFFFWKIPSTECLWNSNNNKTPDVQVYLWSYKSGQLFWENLTKEKQCNCRNYSAIRF